MSTEPMLARVLLAAVVAAAALFDLRERRIPNRLTFPAMGAGVGIGLGADGLAGGGGALAGLATGFGLLLIPYALGAVKAGDVKLLMAIGAFLGPWRTLWAFLLGSVAGGLLSVAVLGVTRTGRRRVATFWIQMGNFISTRDPSVLKPSSAGSTLFVPYGLALAVGALAALFGEGTLYT